MSPAPRPTPLSACVIARDEADRIGPCLESLAFCDEIVVLDSGSTDGTPALCRARGARVVETDWPGWVAQKNRAVQAAAHDWVLALDADERVDDALREAIERLRATRLSEPAAPAAFAVRRKTCYLGRWIRHGGWYPEWRTRLFDRRRARWGGVDPHDRVEVGAEADGAERIRQGDLEHHTYRSVSDHLARMNRYTSAAAIELHARGRRVPLGALVLRPAWRFLRMYVLRAGFLDGRAGFVLAVFDAFYVFLKYVKLRELERGGRAT